MSQRHRERMPKGGHPPIVVPEDFRVIAHRGASGYAPENTVAAFSLAERMGVHEVELDVQSTLDDQLVVCHDRVLDRYGHPGVAVSRTSLSELKRLDMGTWFSREFSSERMITLDELLECFGSRFIYHIEIKELSPGIEERVLSSIQEHDRVDACIVTSFHYTVLARIRTLHAAVQMAYLVRESEFVAESIGLAHRIGCTQICPPACAVTSRNVRRAHSLLPEVRVHHVEGREDALRVIETGCDGLTINWPDWVVYRTRKG